MATNNAPVPADAPISVRVSLQGTTRKFKIPLSDLTPQVLPSKVRFAALLELDGPLKSSNDFERYSDSAAAYVTLDSSNQHVYKTLYRAAKAKGKLRLKATIPSDSNSAIFPPLNPLGLPVTFASAFPEFSRFGSETTLNSNNVASAQPATPRAQASAETLIPITNASTTSIPSGVAKEEEAKADAPSTKRPSTRLSRDGFFAELANLSRQRELALRMKDPPPVCSWSVFCNACDKPMANEHFHCNICDAGDYDLCETCVNAGIHCRGESHWLVKRFVKNGQVVNSQTERVSPKPRESSETVIPEMPGAYTEHVDEKKVEHLTEEYEPTRTCNCCVKGTDSAFSVLHGY